MKKYVKWIAVLITIGTIIGILIAFLCKNKCEEEEFNFDIDDEDDFDLDSDLQPVPEREYVPLTKPASQTE